MRILLTNDDGIDAPGLEVLGRTLAGEGHDLVIAAPPGDLSGSGTALGALQHGTTVNTVQVELAALPGVEAYRIDAPPAFAVLAACTGALGPRPDVVVAGINPGHNAGRAVLHSSTVGAALTAASGGLSAVAVSCGELPASRFDTAATVASAVLHLLTTQLPRRTVLNVNVPDVDLACIKGIRFAPLGPLGVTRISIERSPDGLRMGLMHNGERLRDDRNLNTDSALIGAGYVTLTALSGGLQELHDVHAQEELTRTLAANLPTPADR
jgi:5'-nucleotidase